MMFDHHYTGQDRYWGMNWIKVGRGIAQTNRNPTEDDRQADRERGRLAPDESRMVIF
jgi:hypothetical protein